MGDMKTPDFDDLLAAFDIPDMVDPKAAIESGHDDHEGQIKHSVHVEEDSHVPPVPDVGVSVIVKNIRNVDATEPVSAEKENHSTGNGLHNGFVAMSSIDRYTKDPGKSLKGEGHGVVTKESSFNQFSPISSAEEFDDDDDDKIEVDDPPDKQVSRPCYRANPLTGFVSKQEQDRPKGLGGDSLAKPMQNNEHNKVKTMKRENNKNLVNLSMYEQPKASKTEEKLKESAQKPQDVKGSVEKTGVNVACTSQAKAKSSAKLSSCIAAIAALSAKKATLDTVPRPQSSPSDSPKEIKENLRVINKPMNPQSPIETSKKLFTKQPDSPSSVSSEGSSKGSPSSLAGSTPAIPKVRIKTIKTSSGQIKRTVTSVLPDLNREVCKKGLNQASSIVVSSILSSATSTTVFSSPSRTVQTTVVATTASSTTEMTSKQVTIKPVATAFLPVSAVKTAGSQVINLKLANNTMVKATVIPATSVQSASSAILKAANAIQQQTVVVPASSLANAKFVPKTVHLANLNLLPQTSTTTSELRQVLSKPQQPIKQAMISTPTAKKVSRVQVLASSQSSVVEAFNKVLSSINPVPVYVPNLSPPSAAGIAIPFRGYKCLECGDSFALEKSLTQHYDRRSVRIEVTCNHCAKNLIFYNKCSLLSHARGHKDKGVVMQCSHLILKPIPADQMIASPFPTSVVATTAIHNPTTTVNAVAKTVAAALSTVISAPSSAPVVPAMPLDEDPSKLCRHSLKCLECSEVFRDEASLAMHYQQAVESSGQKANNPGWMCRECDRLFTQREVYVSHMRREHVIAVLIHFFRHCPDPNHTFSKRLMLEKHIQLMHGIKDADVKKITGSTSTEEVPEKEDHKAPSSKRKLEDTVLEFRPRGAITQPLKKLKINVFKVHKCAVCSFTTEDIVKFHEHIPQHKSDGSSFQCRECGLCYTSHNSLSRHLFIVHKLKEPQPVSKQNGSGEDSQQENKLNQGSMVSDSTSDKKCKVCAKTFETEAALSTHMRTHGMAFIKSKRLNSAEK
ncbi:zinc finger protein 532-like [Huso huso]|uniref:Zinc finger protein 532-like n=1 Tax=Huso huso TaxID=61971 RepID=A0ABR1A8Q8_HUSHU